MKTENPQNLAIAIALIRAAMQEADAMTRAGALATAVDMIRCELTPEQREAADALVCIAIEAKPVPNDNQKPAARFMHGDFETDGNA